MARTTMKKTTTTEPMTNETEVKVVKTAPVQETRKFMPSDEIACRSITYGELLVEGRKSKLLYTFANYGDVTYIEYQDLVALRSIHSKALFKPRFIIEDDELIQQWGNDLSPIYSKIVDENLDNIIAMPAAQLKTALQTAPEGVRTAIKSLASDMIVNGTLDGISKIKAIDSVLGTELMLLIEK